MSGAIPPRSQYAFMAWCLVKHRDNFAFTFTFTFTCTFSTKELIPAPTLFVQLFKIKGPYHNPLEIDICYLMLILCFVISDPYLQ
jgi:hypothetical protein